MRPYEIRFTREAVKGEGKLSPRLEDKVKVILEQQVAPGPAAGSGWSLLSAFFVGVVLWRQRQAGASMSAGASHDAGGG